MEPETRRGPNGCVIALAVVGALALCGLMMISGVGYFAYRVFETHQTLERERATKARASEDASEAASTSAKAALPRLTALPPPIMVMSADKTLVRDEALNFAGEYKPKAPVANGRYVLVEIDFGANSEFGDFEHAGAGHGTSPLAFVFQAASDAKADSKSPPKTVRVAVDTYRLTRERLEFRAHDDRIGDIVFAGAIDPAFLIRLDDPNRSPAFEDTPILTGDLTMGGQVTKNVGFSYLLEDASED